MELNPVNSAQLCSGPGVLRKSVEDPWIAATKTPPQISLTALSLATSVHDD